MAVTIERFVKDREVQAAALVLGEDNFNEWVEANAKRIVRRIAAEDAAAIEAALIAAEQAVVAEAERVLAENTAWYLAKFGAEDEGWRVDGHA